MIMDNFQTWWSVTSFKRQMIDDDSNNSIFSYPDDEFVKGLSITFALTLLLGFKLHSHPLFVSRYIKGKIIILVDKVQQ